jgi:hypothetical protein
MKIVDSSSGNDRSLFNFIGLGVLLLLMLVLFLATTQRWMFPADIFDGRSYVAMAEHPVLARDQVPSHHYQRILPSLIVRGIGEISGIGIRAGFVRVGNVAFIALGLALYLFLHRYGNNSVAAFLFTLLLLTASWPLAYNLVNVYQLTDLFTYLIALVLLVAMRERRPILLLLAALIGVFSRQNLILPALGGAIWFIREAFRKESGASASPLRFGVPLFVLAAIAAGVWLVFSLPADYGRMTLKHIAGLPPVDSGLDLIWPLYLLSPFILAAVCHASPMWGAAKRYWPMAIFILATIVQPYAYWSATGADNAMRLMNQGVWLIQVAAALCIMKAMERAGRRRALNAILLVAVLCHGTPHLVANGICLKPFGFLPDRVRFLVNGMLAIPALLIVWANRRSARRAPSPCLTHSP